MGIRAACVEDIRDGAEEALPTRSKPGSSTLPAHAPKAGPNSATQSPTSNEVICAGQALGRQYMETSLPTTCAIRRSSRPSDRQKARRPPNHHLRPRRSPRARPIPQNTPNPQLAEVPLATAIPTKIEGAASLTEIPRLILQAARGQTPRLGQKSPRQNTTRRPCAKRRKTTLYYTQKGRKTVTQEY